MEIQLIKNYLGYEIWGTNCLGINEVLTVDTIKKFLSGYPYPYRLALYPLHYLTKEIVHKEQKFRPMDRLKIHIETSISNYDEGCLFIEELKVKAPITKHHSILPLTIGILDQLHEWGFDTADLIKNGHALDRTTDPETPNLYNTIFD